MITFEIIRLRVEPGQQPEGRFFSFFPHLYLSFHHLSEMSEDIGKLSTAKYGKSKVRVFRIVREEEKRHYVVEYNVTVLLEGEIETRYVDVACVVDCRYSWWIMV